MRKGKRQFPGASMSSINKDSRIGRDIKPEPIREAYQGPPQIAKFNARYAAFYAAHPDQRPPSMSESTDSNSRYQGRPQ